MVRASEVAEKGAFWPMTGDVFAAHLIVGIVIRKAAARGGVIYGADWCCAGRFRIASGILL